MDRIGYEIGYCSEIPLHGFTISACPVARFSYDASPMVSVSMFIRVGLAIVAFVIVIMTLIPLA